VTLCDLGLLASCDGLEEQLQVPPLVSAAADDSVGMTEYFCVPATRQRQFGRRLGTAVESAARFELANVFDADFVGGEETQEWGAACCSFYGWTAIGFFALDDANDCGDNHAGFMCGFNRCNGGGAGSADVVDDDHVGTFAAEAFDAACGAVSLFCFANQEAMQERRA
jgi:hypothetical protein